jgi:hypothetical protein
MPLPAEFAGLITQGRLLPNWQSDCDRDPGRSALGGHPIVDGTSPEGLSLPGVGPNRRVGLRQELGCVYRIQNNSGLAQGPAGGLRPILVAVVVLQ